MKKRVGKKAGVGKVTDWDYIRLMEGDAVADLSGEDRGRIQSINAWLRGDMVELVAGQFDKFVSRKEKNSKNIFAI